MKSGRTDGFHLVVGASAVIVGLVRLFRSAGTGWSLLLVGLGLVLLATQWIIANDVAFESAGSQHALVALLGGVCVWAAAMYLTRGADDLPHFLPGRDADSEHLRAVPGVVALMVGAVLIVRAIALARPQRTIARRSR